MDLQVECKMQHRSLCYSNNNCGCPTEKRAVLLPDQAEQTNENVTPSHPEKEAKEELWQTVNPNQPKYAMSTNLTTKGMAVDWIDLWCEIENWYGDHTKKETAEQLLMRLQNKFTLKTQPRN